MLTSEPSILVEVTGVGGGAYAAGDAVGGLITIPGAVSRSQPSGLIGTLALIEAAVAAAQAAQTSIFFFDRAITAPTNNSAFAPGVSDMSNCLGSVEVAATDWVTFSAANGAVATKTPGIEFSLAVAPALFTGSLYAVWVTRGTPTYPGGSNKLFIRVSIIAPGRC